MRILDKYILKELMGPFFFGIAAFSSIFIASSMLYKLTQYMTKYGASIESLFQLFLYSLPEVINYTFPMSMLLASLLAMGRLSASSEITAMKSGGISFARIAAPVLVVGFVVSLFSVVWAEKVVPASKVAYTHILNYEIKHDTKPRSQEHVVIKSLSGDNLSRLTYARSFDEETGMMKDITIEEFEHGELSRIQKAKTAEWRDGAWFMQDGSVFTVTSDGINQSLHFIEQVLPITVTPKEITLDQKEPDEMTLNELQEYIHILEAQYLPTNKYWMEIYMRFSIPMASFFFALVGVPLGLQPQRASSSIGLGISIIVIFVYYAIMTLTSGLGRGGALPPLLAAIIPNALCLIAGIWLMRKKSQ
ncbi:MAG TPA: LPS export ABC transporter permease LptG [Candidatus Avacidaminococcus intestinavium]|uniref:LPS export ABC transporter permease LptG n=1 Tax=Candidatus Avacidaminococcus intestinavium TaxID=2840684 RepID=A0A9D1MNV5_9FIRM|nr:LPS export ABC transporter permease LptG [Candidatus Avacidaminococcus intestinavium]